MWPPFPTDERERALRRSVWAQVWRRQSRPVVLKRAVLATLPLVVSGLWLTLLIAGEPLRLIIRYPYSLIWSLTYHWKGYMPGAAGLLVSLLACIGAIGICNRDLTRRGALTGALLGYPFAFVVFVVVAVVVSRLLAPPWRPSGPVPAQAFALGIAEVYQPSSSRWVSRATCSSSFVGITQTSGEAPAGLMRASSLPPARSLAGPSSRTPRNSSP